MTLPDMTDRRDGKVAGAGLIAFSKSRLASPNVQISGAVSLE
jgi:hypothetical protein